MNRYLASMPPGLVVTTALLLLMQQLVATGNDVMTAGDTRIAVDWIRDRMEPPPPPVIPDNKPERLPDPAPLPETGPTSSLPIGTTASRPTLPGPPLPDPFGTALAPAADGPLVNTVRVRPQYPPPASARGLEGVVVLRFDVNAAGGVENVQLVEASHAVFVPAAIRALQGFRYRPRIVSGEPVATNGLQTAFRFTLEDG